MVNVRYPAAFQDIRFYPLNLSSDGVLSCDQSVLVHAAENDYLIPVFLANSYRLRSANNVHGEYPIHAALQPGIQHVVDISVTVSVYNIAAARF